MHRFGRDVYEMVLNEVEEEIRGCRKIIDIGAGDGFLISLASQRFPGKLFVALDKSLALLEIGNRFCKTKIYFIAGDVHNLPLKGSIFDLAFSTGSINLWTSPVKGLSEIKRVLRKGGKLLLYDEDRAYLKPSDMFDALFRRKLFSVGFTAYSQDEVRNFLVKAGFKIRHSSKVGCILKFLAK